MNINKHLLTTCLFSFFASFQVFSSDYYVATTGSDSNLGNMENPFKTIQHAIDVVNGGDTIYVYGGVYGEKVKFQGNADSGTSGNLVTLTNVPGELPIIDGSNLSVNGRQGLITVEGASFIKITGFELRDFKAIGNPTPCGFYMDGTCNTIEFSNNKIHNIENNETCNQSDGSSCYVGAHAIGVFGTTTTGITNIVFDNNEIYDNILMSSEAFVINGNVDGFTQTNNYVHNNNNIGFDYIGFEDECASCGNTDRARNGIVKGNRAENNSSVGNPWYGTDASAGGFYVDGGENIIFENNISTGNDMGFEVASEHNGKNTQDIIVRNNYIYLNGQVGISIGGSVSSAAAINISVINNTFYKNHGWGSEIVFQSYVQDSSIMNNIFYADNTDAFESYNPNTNSRNIWGNNLYYNGADGDNEDVVSTANPKLIDPNNGNLDLAADSPAIGLGSNTATNISDVDIKGNQRIADGIVDLGAHEFNSTTLNTISFNEKNYESIDVFPNPFTNEINIDASKSNVKATTTLLTHLSGKEVFTINLQNEFTTLNQLPNIAPGVYILQVLDLNNNIIKAIKIIKN